MTSFGHRVKCRLNTHIGMWMNHLTGMQPFVCHRAIGFHVGDYCINKREDTVCLKNENKYKKV